MKSDPTKWGVTTLQLQRPEHVFFRGELRPWDEAKIDGDSELVSRFNEYFYSAPDYGIIATKP